jgi:hypothetical protein
LAHIPGISVIAKQRLLIEKLLRKIFRTYSKLLPFVSIMLSKNATNGETVMCEVNTLWDKCGWGNQTHMKHDMHDKGMICKHKNISVGVVLERCWFFWLKVVTVAKQCRMHGRG